MEAESSEPCQPLRSHQASRFQCWGQDPCSICHKTKHIKMRGHSGREIERNTKRLLEKYRSLHAQRDEETEDLYEKPLLRCSLIDYKMAGFDSLDSISLRSMV